MDQREWLRFCAEELALDGVELLDRHFPNTDMSYLREIKKLCADLYLTICGASVSNDFGRLESAEGQQEMERVKSWVDNAQFLGAPVLRVFAGWVPAEQRQEQGHGVGRLVGRLLRREGGRRRLWTEMVSCLRECAAYAEEKGIVLGLENHDGNGLVVTADEVERCLREVGSPWLRLNLDTGNYGDLASIERTLPHAVKVHAKFYDVDEEGRDRRLEWERIMGILSDGGYRGFLSIEYEGAEDPRTALPRAVGYLRRLMRGA
ncbi:MAG: sugar phosphate isomerase/epimerase [Candidatus Bathyarchaeota archaeon]|nr:sugar phosphate isomerase/epimerase [Candidatus Bathyarchaeota archaeon]